MSEFYQYLDPGFTYIDSETGLLKNRLGISDKDTLLFIESGAVTKRLKELDENPIKITNIENLFEIHKYLFQDIYDWAGKERVVEISKDGKQFFPIGSFDRAYKYINSLIDEFNSLPRNNKKEIVSKLAEILDNVNYLHPFREGNGRAQRAFIKLLALNKGLKLNLNPPDDKTVYERYMQGTIESDVSVLTSLIEEQIVKTN
jgi:cell filamentation protein